MKSKEVKFEVGLKYRINYTNGTSCDFEFIGGKEPMVQILRGEGIGNSKLLEAVVRHYESIVDIE